MQDLKLILMASLTLTMIKVIKQTLQQNSKLQTHASNGYRYIWQDRQLWRMYSTEDAELKMSVTMLQPVGERFKELAQNVMGYSLVLILLWFMQWLILHFAVKRQFKVIQQLSKNIAEKNADVSFVLSPLSHLLIA